MARGASINNPLNLMMSRFLWVGEQRPTKDPDKRLCTFDTIENGIRAGAVNLLSYYLHDECDTIRLIIERYAPPPNLAPQDANNTEDYINFMAERLGIQDYMPLNMTNEAFLMQWIFAQIHFEQGADVCTIAQIVNGVHAALAYKGV